MEEKSDPGIENKYNYGNELVNVKVEKDDNNGLLILVEDNDDNNGKDKSTVKKVHHYWIDALRIFASYMVVLVHACNYALDGVEMFSNNWYASRLWNALCRPCVPLFIMISGSLFLDPDRNFTIKKMYKKYIFRIFRALFFWNLIYVTLCKFVIGGIKNEFVWNSQLVYNIYDEFLMGKYHMWYLYMCIGLYAMTPFLRAICKEKVLTEYFILSSVIILQAIPFVIFLVYDLYPNRYVQNIGNFIGKFNFALIGGYYCHYVMGHYFNAYKIKSKLTLTIIFFCGIFFSVFTYGIQLILSKKYKQLVNDFEDYLKLNVTIASVAIYLFFKYPLNRIISFVFRGKYLKSFLKQLSGVTFGIYQVHVIYLELFENLNLRYYDRNHYLFLPIHALLIWVISGVTTFIMKKIPILRKFV